MTAGQLKALITIEQSTRAATATGGGTYTWSTLAKVWANIRTPNESESLQLGAMRSSANSVIHIRYRADVTNAMRATHGGKTYTFDGVVDPDGRSEWLKIMAKS